MRLHRLALKHFRGVTEREVSFPDVGVVVIEGANEVGKSSMIEALDLLLEEKDSSTKQSVRAVRPVDSDVGTTVEAELSAGPYRFSFRKTWNKGHQTVLTVNQPVPEQLTGIVAHERVRQILSETTDERLFKALRLLQAQPVQAGRLGDSGALIAALDRAAGTAGEVAEGEPLIDAVQGEYLRYFTPTGRLTGDRLAADAELRRADSAVADAAAAVTEVTDELAEHERLTAELGVCRATRDAAALDLDRLLSERKRLTVLVESRDLAAAALAEARGSADRAVADHGARQQQILALTRRRAALDTVRGRIAGLAEAADSAGCRLEELRRQQSWAAEQAETAGRVAELARSDADHLQDLADLQRVRARLAELDLARQEAAEADAELAGAPVDLARLRGIEGAARDHDRALAAHTAAAGRLDLHGLAGIRVLVNGEPVDLSPGELVRQLVSEPVEIEVLGTLRVRVEPAGDAAAHAERVRRLGADLSRLLCETGVADIEEARTAHRAHLAATARRDTARRDLVRLRAAGSEDELRSRTVDLAAAVDEYRRDRPAGGAPAAELATARTAARVAGESERTARTGLAEASRMLALELDRQHHDQLELVRLGSEATVLQGELEAAARELDAARAVATDELLMGAAAARTRLAQDAAAELDRLDADLRRSDLAGLTRTAEEVGRTLARLDSEVAALAEAVVSVRATLEAYGSQGRQETLDRALSDRSAAGRRQAAVGSRANAVKLLREVILRHRDEAKANYVSPFTDELNRLGRSVFGPTFAAEVDADLRVVARTLDGTTLPFDALSTGAREQLAILTRLAAAAVVAPDDGVPVFLDDALGFADPDRLHRIGSAFLAAPHSQLILLTCSPDRYAAIPGAQVIRLGPASPGADRRATPVDPARASESTRRAGGRRTSTGGSSAPDRVDEREVALFELGA